MPDDNDDVVIASPHNAKSNNTEHHAITAAKIGAKGAIAAAIIFGVTQVTLAIVVGNTNQFPEPVTQDGRPDRSIIEGALGENLEPTENPSSQLDVEVNGNDTQGDQSSSPFSEQREAVFDGEGATKSDFKTIRIVEVGQKETRPGSPSNPTRSTSMTKRIGKLCDGKPELCSYPMDVKALGKCHDWKDALFQVVYACVDNRKKTAELFQSDWLANQNLIMTCNNTDLEKDNVKKSGNDNETEKYRKPELISRIPVSALDSLPQIIGTYDNCKLKY